VSAQGDHVKRITQAIVLAAGEGQRLKPFTRLMPKVMLPIAGKPILQYVVEALVENGVRRIVMVVGYRREHVQDYFGSGQAWGAEIEYVVQPKQLGVAHALKQGRPLADDQFLVVAGDNVITHETLVPLLNTPPNAMLVKIHEDTVRYKAVLVEGGWVKGFRPDAAKSVGGPIDIGAYAFTRDVFDFIGDEVSLTPVMRKMIEAGRPIAAVETEGFWQDAVYPWDILKINDMVLNKITPMLGGTIEEGSQMRGLVSVGEGTVIHPNCYVVGPVVIGDDCEIGPNVCIFPSTSIGNNVVLSPFTVIRNSSIGNDVTIGPMASVCDSIIAPGTIIGSHFAVRTGEGTIEIEGAHHTVKMGAIIGSYCQFGDAVTIEPGTIVGNNCRVRSSKALASALPEGSLVV